MAQEAYFFDAVLSEGIYDRPYNADDFARFFVDLVGSGVVYTDSTKLRVSATSGMTVQVSPGSAFLRARKYINTANMNLVLDTAHGSLPRIDRITVRMSRVARTIEARILKGTAAASPSPAALTKTEDIYDISLAQVYVGAGVSAIGPESITDERLDPDACGIVTGLITQIDASELFTQLEAQFGLWFDSILGQLTGDPATSLQAQINALSGQIGFSGVTGGTAPAYTLTLNDFTLVAGQKVEVKIHAASSTPVTLNITSHNTSTSVDTVLGARQIVDSYGSQINYLTKDSYLTLVYNGTAFQVIGLATQYARYA